MVHFSLALRLQTMTMSLLSVQIQRAIIFPCCVFVWRLIFLYWWCHMWGRAGRGEAWVIECHTRSVPDRTIHELPSGALHTLIYIPLAVQLSAPCSCNICTWHLKYIATKDETCKPVCYVRSRAEISFWA